jgi:malate dehydrogenase
MEDSRRLTSSRFAEAVIKASKGEKGIVEPTFVYLPGVTGGDAITKATGLEFFSTPVELGVSFQISNAC